MAKIDPTVAKAIQGAIDRNMATLQAIKGFVAARPGYPIRGGKVVSQPALIVYVDQKLPPQ